MRRSWWLSVPVLGAALTNKAAALETDAVGTKPVRVDVTNATSVFYNADNRNSRPGSVARTIDDDWGVWYNRLNMQASWKSWQAGLRLDSAWFYRRPDPVGVGLELLNERRAGVTAAYTADDATFFVQKTTEASKDLGTRYVDWIYPSKYYVGYSTRDVEATVGDFYAQLGRGLVLSVRKLDELSSDTTVRGARMTGHVRAGALLFKITGLGGELNPLRLDEASGRYLGVTSTVISGPLSVTEAGMPRAVTSPFERSAEPTYAPDRIVGAELQGGTQAVRVGVQGSLLGRTLMDRGNGIPSALSPGAVRSAQTVRTASVSVSAPDIGGHAAAYLEVGLQELAYPSEIERVSSELPDSGHAVYGSLSVSEGALTVTGEAKHYRRFFPLLANVDLARAPEFSAVQYSSPPTTEAFWIDTEFEGFDTCVTGGRLKGDVQVGPQQTVFAWVGRYLTWAESITNERCRTNNQNLNRVWDLAAGFEILSNGRRSRATWTVGSRFDDTDRTILDPASGVGTHSFYRELYGRYDVIQWLGGPFSLKLQGWERRRDQTLGGPDEPWLELQHVTAIDWAPRISVGAGVEYTGNPQFPPTYFNGMLTYNLSPSSNISLFAGQRRGGLRCVSGICRVYPPFEGVRLDATFRF